MLTWLHRSRPRPSASALAARSWALVGALVVFSWAPRVSAYCRTTTCPRCDADEQGCPTGEPLSWPTSCVTYSMQYQGSKQVDLETATAIMDKAFAVWQEATCDDGGQRPSIATDRRFGNAACDLHEYNQTDANANVVMFRDDKWPYEGSPNVLALTTVTYSRKTGAIYDVDMEVNATQRLSVSDPVPPTSYDLQSILTHEVGHFLGLAHSHLSTATMWFQYTPGTESFRLLSADDAEGICAVYPPGTPAQCNATPRQGFTPDCGIFPSGGGGMCALAGGPRGATPRYQWLGVAGLVAAVTSWARRARRSQVSER